MKNSSLPSVVSKIQAQLRSIQKRSHPLKDAKQHLNTERSEVLALHEPLNSSIKQQTEIKLRSRVGEGT
ncbi:MAG: hypothetical protein XE04_0592 [Marinimicrobia bacterium 46_43]|nr:MAG: hypothetical protein XE04_0592 [Marinimicrobia bacterium 46_43]